MSEVPAKYSGVCGDSGNGLSMVQTSRAIFLRHTVLGSYHTAQKVQMLKSIQLEVGHLVGAH